MEQKELLFQKTNGGLDIILDYLPQARESVNSPTRKFKIRDEKTPSASLKLLEKGYWVVTDFGGDSISKDAVGIAMEFEHLSYFDTLHHLLKKFDCGQSGKPNAENRSDVIRRIRTKSPDESFEADIRFKEWEESLLPLIFASSVTSTTEPQGLIEICIRYGLHPLSSYTFEAKDQIYEIKSTIEQPLFAWVIKVHEETHYQIYSPKALKQYRFKWINGRPRDFVFGLSQCTDAYNTINASELDADASEITTGVKNKLKEVILCSGGTDALNIAAMGYPVLWLNSESSEFGEPLYSSLKSISDKILVAYDIDATGLRHSHELNLKYLDLCKVILPSTLRNHKDWRGYPRKDIKDFLSVFSIVECKKLIETAKPYQFWNKCRSRERIDYSINIEYLLYFLEQNGFCQIKLHEQTMLVQVSNHIVTQLEVREIRAYIIDFLRSIQAPTDLLNKVHKSSYLTAQALETLAVRELNFKSGGPGFQILHFKNASVLVEAKGRRILKSNEIEHYVFEDQVIQRDYLPLNPSFNLKVQGREVSLEVEHNDSVIFQFTQKTCEVHWRVKEQGKDYRGIDLGRNNLSEEELYEEYHHLLNRLYSIGYLLHAYKDAAKARAILFIENNLLDPNESHGGSGKTLFAVLLEQYIDLKIIPSRNSNLFRNSHFRENISSMTKVIAYDDCYKGFPFHELFSDVTNSMLINPKGKRSFELKFNESPKIMLSSNYPVGDLDGSSKRRLLINCCSNYFHVENEVLKLEGRKPTEVYHQTFFNDFNESEWAKTDNFIMDCIQLYLSSPFVLEAPSQNYRNRFLLQKIHEDFKDWADSFFAKNTGNSNQLWVKSDLIQAYNDYGPKYKLSPAKFKKQLEAWCNFQGFVLNPQEMQGADGRVIKRVPETNKVSECFFIGTENNSSPFVEF